MFDRCSRGWATSVLLALVGCGGGDGGEEPIRVTVAPTVLEASFLQGDNLAPIGVEATLSREPDGDVYVAIVDSGAALESSVSISYWALQAHVELKPSCALAPGVHEGTITLLLCRDQACTRRIPLSGNVLPYRFTVAPGAALRVAVDGAAVPGLWSACSGSSLRLHVGQTVTATSGIPVAWTVTRAWSSGSPTWTVVSSSETSWTGIMGREWGGGTLGTVEIAAAPTGVRATGGRIMILVEYP